MIERDHSPFETMGASMTKDKLVEKIRELLKTDNDLDFLLIFEEEQLERLVACIRDRVGQGGG